MNPGCLFGPLLWLFGRDLEKSAKPTKPTADSPMGEGEIHSGPGGYEGGSYEGGYAAEYFDEDH